MAEMATDDEFICFIDPFTFDQFDLRPSNLRVVQVEQSAAPTAAAAAGSYRSPADMLRLTRATWAETLDVFFCPSVYTYYPLPPRLPAVVTIHDAIPERFPGLTLPSARARLFWKGKVRLAIWQSRLILTVSDYAARDLTSIMGIPAGRIRVISEAPSPSFQPIEFAQRLGVVPRRWGVPEHAQWILYVGGFNPHKNVESLVRAHARIVKEAPSGSPFLLLVGATDGDVFYSGQASIRSEIERAGTTDFVKWTGFVPDEDLAELYSGALALVLPSACEGFGLPAVEAAACGTPVVATRESPLPELLAGGGVFVPPGNDDALVEALKLLVNDDAARLTMGERALERARLLNWRDSARNAMQVLREAMNGGG
jgi:glycosyltransferase involved in cell wall biosynthesis